jgi:hypothetical protein
MMIHTSTLTKFQVNLGKKSSQDPPSQLGVWWHQPVILVMAGRIKYEDCGLNKNQKYPQLKVMSQVVERLPGKPEALSSDASTAKNILRKIHKRYPLLLLIKVNIGITEESPLLACLESELLQRAVFIAQWP